MIEISIRQSDQRLIAESDFTLPGGKEIRKGDEGGIVSACARIEKSWVSYESSVQGFKWNETQAPLKDVLALTPEKPLFGQQTGRVMRTHWLVFMKPEQHQLPEPT